MIIEHRSSLNFTMVGDSAQENDGFQIVILFTSTNIFILWYKYCCSLKNIVKFIFRYGGQFHSVIMPFKIGKLAKLMLSE